MADSLKNTRRRAADWKKNSQAQAQMVLTLLRKLRDGFAEACGIVEKTFGEIDKEAKKIAAEYERGIEANYDENGNARDGEGEHYEKDCDARDVIGSDWSEEVGSYIEDAKFQVTDSLDGLIDQISQVKESMKTEVKP